MYPQLPDIAGLGDRTLCLDFFGLFVNIEVILYGFLGIEGVQELIDLGGIVRILNLLTSNSLPSNSVSNAASLSLSHSP